MQAFKVLVVEDDPAERELLKGLLARFSTEHGPALGVELLPSALEFVNSRRACDLVLMDIDMPGINGLEAAEIFRSYDAQTPLIFVTNLAQYAVRGYSVDALDFVVKPVEYHDFELRMVRALRVMRRNAVETVGLPTQDGVRVVPVSNVVFVDLARHDVQYHLTGGEVLGKRGSLRAVEERLAQKGFLRISSGCLVNMGQIVRIGQESVHVSTGEELFFSRSQRRRALEELANFMARSL